MNASTIVTSLIDIASKNGNFLLDIGPVPNGTILNIEQRHLRDAGAWISDHAEAIFNPTYWFATPEDTGNANVRFTTTMDAFYIRVLAKPNVTLAISAPVPWVAGGEVKVVGGNMSGSVVPSSAHGEGVMLNISSEVQRADQWTWVFKIELLT
jgi:alpha-L-fucosidase